MRNNSINLEVAKKKGILVCGTEINSNPAAEITLTLILGLLRNVKQDIDNMFQGYWQTTIGTELKVLIDNIPIKPIIKKFCLM